MTEHQNDATELEEDTQHGKFLTFSLGDEVFGIEIKYVTEIIGMQSVTSVPEVPEYVKGIINLRGKIIPVISVRMKFKKAEIPYDDRTCIIVVDMNEISAGLIVDRVMEVMTIDDENIVPLPDYKSGAQNRFIKGIGKAGESVKLLLDCERFFGEDEIAEIQDIK